MGGTVDLLMIIVVLGVVFFLAWYVTRFIGLRSKDRAAGRFMRVVDRLSISNDKAILLVKIGSEYSVIGVTGHQMSLLGRLDQEQADAFAQEAGARAQGAGGDAWRGMQIFGERIGSAMRGSAAPPKHAPPKPAQPKPAQPNPPQPKPAQAKPAQPVPPQASQGADRSAIDMIDERIKLRKETKRW